MDTCAIVPAFNARDTIEAVLDDLRATLGVPVIVVDDGSTDATAQRARGEAVHVVRHERNLGKGAALRTGLTVAARHGYAQAVTVDADGQHPGASARAVLEASPDPSALVLGVRDQVRDGTPGPSRFGNAVSDFWVSLLSGRRLHDTQCGLRRYPVARTLALAARSRGFAFEAEVVMRAVAAGVPVVEVPVRVFYPAPEARRSHFHVWRDPARITAIVARTAFDLHLPRW